MSPRERSTAHPSATWSECLSLIKQLDELGKGPVSLGVLASAFNIKNWKTKTFQSKITSAKQFGLVSIKNGAINLTDDGYSLLHPTQPNMRPAELALFARPSLYGQLLTAYEGKAVPRRDLFENILEANYGISAAAKKKAAETFMTSAEELGILSNGIVAYDDAVAAANRETAPNESDPVIEQTIADIPSAATPAPIAAEPATCSSFVLRIPISTGAECIEIKIPDGAEPEDLEMAKEMIGVYSKRIQN